MRCADESADVSFAALPWLGRADAPGKVADHETGHAQGLAHVSDAAIGTRAAIRRKGALFYSDVQTDDRDGIIDIYGAYP